MVEYKELSADEAYRLINSGPMVMVSSYAEDGAQNIAPVAWCCPVNKTPSRILVTVGQRHKTYSNIEETGKFIVSVPGPDLVDVVKKTGSVSGKEVNKFDEFAIKSFKGKEVEALIPEGSLGYIECDVYEIFKTGVVGLMIGECKYGAVRADAYAERILAEKKAGKALHHLGGKKFVIPGDDILA